ncbi:hypothetical protein [Mucilaginibacter kameinonensis]|uniref:hypothetical protein n=1 Tax=Mucilaginibacter kameinonensis TaxID=452286 RepID=UPI0013CE6454|nr:hypothetical protein [Mucilaginibacter kameinonensis]
MKQIKPGIYFLAACAVLIFSNCRKPHDIKTPTVDPNIVNAMYPARMSFYDGSQSAYPRVYTYTYDKDNHLTRYGKDSLVVWDINAHQVSSTVFDYPNSISAFTYSYGLVAIDKTPGAVDIYTGLPTQVSIDFFYKDLHFGTTRSNASGLWQFELAGGHIMKALTSDGGGRNYNYSYDKDGNLSGMTFVSLTGPRAGAEYYRFTVKSLDDKSSPFSSVKGYGTISYPQSYFIDYAQAFCKKNPIQIVGERYDETKNAFVIDEQDDFTYQYNDKGYPTQIVVSMTYFEATTTHYTRTYNYTYK